MPIGGSISVLHMASHRIWTVVLVAFAFTGCKARTSPTITQDSAYQCVPKARSEIAKAIAERDKALAAQSLIQVTPQLLPFPHLRHGGAAVSPEAVPRHRSFLEQFRGAEIGQIVRYKSLGHYEGVLVNPPAGSWAILARRGDDSFLVVPDSSRAISCRDPNAHSWSPEPESTVFAVPQDTHYRGKLVLPVEAVYLVVEGGMGRQPPPP
jgi:hypothetical protein